ncbi:16S rRNA (adenine(1518)-N(6)/adenine(1519)-N(6))-dimethyltransferase RsmA [Helicobacter sp. MIT 99-5507]|uniref:16S rRNA (adenine(1518)-N(6)/adenine(1519)-N(6))- dimethyltransferase RsmA n=1 Tax=Helicobacter sp. MIT 99-5507 TaxID=152489 RepID=UPI002163D03C|nr:16S rRNA (adenine(1518)-N(6)/adenine(1519)-N(6))-dimethyltransferase RsmA [Helicobacter sp. MIT 99-5507]
MKANKKFGQNFLKDEAVLNKIIESVSNMVNIFKNEEISLDIIEIGPGLGDLSVKLLDSFSLIAYEIDKRLCKYLDDRFSKDNFILHNKDVLSIELSKDNKGRSFWLHNKPYILVSNLPYYIATRIILNALEDRMCVGMVVMTQKEVAYKFCAKPLDSDFCAISVITQSLSKEIELISIVPPSAFSPAPKVESAVFGIRKNNNILEKDFYDLIRKAFASPRKTIYKNLSYIKNIEEILETLSIEKNTRAHQLNTSQYHQIFKLTRK